MQTCRQSGGTLKKISTLSSAAAIAGPSTSITRRPFGASQRRRAFPMKRSREPYVPWITDPDPPETKVLSRAEALKMAQGAARLMAKRKKARELMDKLQAPPTTSLRLLKKP